MQKVRKCLKQKNPFVKIRKSPLNLLGEKLTNVFFLNHGGGENRLDRRLKSDSYYILDFLYWGEANSEYDK